MELKRIYELDEIQSIDEDDYTMIDKSGNASSKKIKLLRVLKEMFCKNITTVTFDETVSERELTDYVRAIYAEVTSLTLTLPLPAADDYISSIVFTSGATPTNLVYPDTIKMIGEGCIDGVFTPAASKRYEVIVSYDGANVVGVVGGYAI